MEEAGTLVEQKVMRLLRNAYSRMITVGEYDLASLCAKELHDVCLQVTAAPTADDGGPGLDVEALLAED